MAITINVFEVLELWSMPFCSPSLIYSIANFFKKKIAINKKFKIVKFKALSVLIIRILTKLKSVDALAIIYNLFDIIKPWKNKAKKEQLLELASQY